MVEEKNKEELEENVKEQEVDENKDPKVGVEEEKVKEAVLKISGF